MLLLNIVLASVKNSADELVKHDPYGIFLSIMSITIVITVLSLIYLLFKFISNIIQKREKRKANPKQAFTENVKVNEIPNGEVGAAIAMALMLYSKDMKDQEATSLTIKKMTHRYSPWSSKIYSMRNLR